MGRMKPRIIAIALPPYGQEYKAEHDRSARKVYVLHNGKRVGEVRLHMAKHCVDAGACCIHNPSDHALRNAPMILRLDRQGALIERVCEHGIGHADPDSVDFMVNHLGLSEAEGVHGCDGCC